MENLTIPKDYHSELNLHDTQIAIKTVKDFFQNLLASRLNLSRVSAPLFVDPASGLNDNLNGIERPVTFDILEQNGKEAEVVQSRQLSSLFFAFCHHSFLSLTLLAYNKNSFRKSDFFCIHVFFVKLDYLFLKNKIAVL